MARCYWILSQYHAWSRPGAAPCPEAKKNLLRSQTTPVRVHSPGSLTRSLTSLFSVALSFSCRSDEPLLQWNLDREPWVEEMLELDVACSNRVEPVGPRGRWYTMCCSEHVCRSEATRVWTYSIVCTGTERMCSMRRLFVCGNVPKDVAAQIWRTQETTGSGMERRSLVCVSVSEHVGSSGSSQCSAES